MEALILQCQKDRKDASSTLLGLETHLKQLEADMLPVYQHATRLTTAKANIDAVVSQMSEIQHHFETSSDVEKILVSSGKSQAVSCSSTQFINATERIQDSISFFERNEKTTMVNKTLDKLNSLSKKATNLVLKEFSSALENASLDYDATLRVLAAMVPKTQKKDAYKIYSDFQRSKLQQKTSTLHITDASLLSLFETERDICTSVFNKTDSFTPYIQTIKDILKKKCIAYENDLKKINSEKGSCCVSDIITTTLDTYKILRYEIQDPITKLLTPPSESSIENPSSLEHFNSFMSLVATLVFQTMQKFIESINYSTTTSSTSTISTPSSLPSSDSIIHPKSNVVIEFITKTLIPHQDVIRDLLIKVGKEETDDENEYYLIKLSVDKLVTLIKNTSTAIKVHCPRYYVLYNLSYLHSCVTKYRHSEDCVSAVISHLEVLISSSKREFCSSKLNILKYLERPEAPLKYENASTNTGLLTLESGRVLKEKFSGFNAAYEDIQQCFTIESSSKDLTQELVNELQLKIVPAYREFYKEYAEIRFSKKHHKKYVVYSPDQVEDAFKALLYT